MSIKIVVLIVLAFLAGLAFIGAGIYFLSASFLEKLNASSAADEVSRRKNTFRAKGSGMTAISLGALTIVWGLMLLSFPQIAAALGLVYMFFLIAAFGVITLVFK